MDRPNTKTPQRPRLAFRVGISGARCIRVDQKARLLDELEKVLSLLNDTLSKLQTQEQVARFYAAADGAKVAPLVRVITPRAKGADRLAAVAAYKLGLAVDVPMPFPQAEYERDFKGKEAKCPDEIELTAEEDLAEFRTLLGGHDGMVTLDGSRDDPLWPGGDLFEGQSYEAVGHYVVRHCDLLLAIWDGKAGAGRGGTQEIVEYAARIGVPIWWIHATEQQPPQWIADRLDLRQKTPDRSPADEALVRHLTRLIPAPKRPSHEHPTLLVRLATLNQHRRSSPALEFFAQKQLPDWWFWYTYKVMVKVVSWNPLRKREPDPAYVKAAMPTSEAPAFWFQIYEEADLRAVDYTKRYRSSYVILIALAALSLIAGTLAATGKNWVKARWPQLSELHLLGLIGLPELLLLLGAVAMLWYSIREDWHLKSIEYRLVAELYRKQKTLAALGWALPVAAVEHLADTEGLSWVAWLLAATQRCSPFPHCEVNDAYATTPRVEELLELLKEQIDYHHGTHLNASEAAEGLERLGAFAFVLLAVVAIVKLPLLGFEDEHAQHLGVMVCEVLAGVLPSLSAAFLAMRSYAELQLVAEQSRTMEADLTRAQVRVGKLVPERPLASQALGEEAGAVATLMLQELDGWGRVFRGKLLDLP